jgi:hypothetical protein
MSTILKAPQKPLPRYIKKAYILDPSMYPNRIIEEFLFLNKIDGIYFDFINTTANLNNVEVSIDYGDWYLASMMLGGAEAYGEYFYSFRIRWLPSEDGKKIVVVYTGEKKLRMVSPLQSVAIIREDIGLMSKLNSWSAVKALKFATVNVGTSPTQIVTASTLVNILVIQNNGAIDVYLGDADTQPIKIPAGGGVFSLVLPLDYKIDLSALRLVASASTSVVVMYA